VRRKPSGERRAEAERFLLRLMPPRQLRAHLMKLKGSPS
jgi:hypothetical protein